MGRISTTISNFTIGAGSVLSVIGAAGELNNIAHQDIEAAAQWGGALVCGIIATSAAMLSLHLESQKSDETAMNQPNNIIEYSLLTNTQAV